MVEPSQYASTTKYIVKAKFDVQGVVEKPDVVGAVECDYVLDAHLHQKNDVRPAFYNYDVSSLSLRSGWEFFGSVFYYIDSAK